MARSLSRFALVTSLLAVVTACGVTPQTDVPEPLAGAWSNGSVSMLDYYDPSTGSWAPTTGSGFSYELTEDGTYVFAGLIQSSLYGCTMKVFQYTEGTVVVEDELVTFHPTYLYARPTPSPGFVGTPLLPRPSVSRSGIPTNPAESAGRAYDRIKLEDNCSVESNYEKDGTYEVQSFYWQVGLDEYGASPDSVGRRPSLAP